MDIIRASPDELAQWFTADLAREIRAGAARPGAARRFTLTIPGGSVAERFLPRLAAAALDWDAVDLFWTDERAVPPTAPDANHAVAERLLIGPAGIPAARVHRMRAERADLDAAAGDYAMELAEIAGSPPVLDYVLLGVGPDGHVASIFPGAPLPAGDATVGWIDHAPKPPPRRMTLTLPTLVAARRVVVAAFDASKAGVIAEALEDPHAQTPVAYVLRRAERAALLVTPEVLRRRA